MRKAAQVAGQGWGGVCNPVPHELSQPPGPWTIRSATRSRILRAASTAARASGRGSDHARGVAVSLARPGTLERFLGAC